MSFADDFGHNIPEEGWEGWKGSGPGYSYSSPFIPPEIIHSKGIKVEYATEKAFLILFKTGEKAWIPKSQVTIKDGTLYAPDWLMKSLVYLK